MQPTLFGTDGQRTQLIHVGDALQNAILDAYWERMQQGGRKSFTYEEMDKTWRIKSHRDILVHYLEPLSRDLGEREDDFS